MNYDQHEDKMLLSLINKKKSKILDVGCGFGRYLIPLSEMGHEVYGIDKNIEVVKNLQTKGFFNVYTFETASSILTDNFDYIIMSHIIEHIEPKEIISFFDSYLKYLKFSGKLIIATPMMHRRFYYDYDHIKPYTFHSIRKLFSDGFMQYQEKPTNRLKLDKIWIRKDPFTIEYPYGSGSRRKFFINFFNEILIIIYKVSFKIISEKTGWIGVFTKLS
ncbi:MAG: class I SAM-dependent methyltransferase [Candidatus Helarchaeota archaeon]